MPKEPDYKKLYEEEKARRIELEKERQRTIERLKEMNGSVAS